MPTRNSAGGPTLAFRFLPVAAVNFRKVLPTTRGPELAMPHYFFDLLNGLGLTPDEHGAVLPDESAARERAIQEARAIMAHEVLKGHIDLGGRLIVRSKPGDVVLEVGFDEALQIDGLDD